MAASDYDDASSASGSDSEPETAERAVRGAESRLGQRQKARATAKPAAPVKNLAKYERQAPLSQKKIKVRVHARLRTVLSGDTTIG